MKTIILFIVLILILLICIPTKEKFMETSLYPGVHAYYRV